MPNRPAIVTKVEVAHRAGRVVIVPAGGSDDNGGNPCDMAAEEMSHRKAKKYPWVRKNIVKGRIYWRFEENASGATCLVPSDHPNSKPHMTQRWSK